jgi:lipopolysaccharide/colanic/teichoic acid biosynthesis glycosyltransferase
MSLTFDDLHQAIVQLNLKVKRLIVLFMIIAVVLVVILGAVLVLAWIILKSNQPHLWVVLRGFHG